MTDSRMCVVCRMATTRQLSLPAEQHDTSIHLSVDSKGNKYLTIRLRTCQAHSQIPTIAERVTGEAFIVPQVLEETKLTFEHKNRE